MQIKSFILSATSLCLMSAPVIADSGYYSSCNSVNVYRKDTQPNKGRPDIIGNCRKITGIYSVDTAINIDSCFANNGGNLVARLNGGFSNSCSKLSMQGSTLKATCGNGRGGYTDTSIDTNAYIGNYDGRMKCFGQSGY